MVQAADDRRGARVNKRRFERVGFKTEALIDIDGMEIRGEVEDLSPKGLFVRTGSKLEIGTSVRISLFFYGSSGRMSFGLDASVVRLADDGIGFKFDRIDIESLVHIAYGSMPGDDKPFSASN